MQLSKLTDSNESMCFYISIINISVNELGLIGNGKKLFGHRWSFCVASAINLKLHFINMIFHLKLKMENSVRGAIEVDVFN